MTHICGGAPKAQNDQQIAELDRVHFYLQRRQALIDYPFFQKRGYPIGSGCVESGHKVVVQRRLKGAGMRWAEEHVNPLLALRDLVCNDRWQTGWQDSVSYQQHQRDQKRRQRVQAKQPQPSLIFGPFFAFQYSGIKYQKVQINLS